jgi:hypothetical protein
MPRMLAKETVNIIPFVVPAGSAEPYAGTASV